MSKVHGSNLLYRKSNDLPYALYSTAERFIKGEGEFLELTAPFLLYFSWEKGRCRI